MKNITWSFSLVMAMITANAYTLESTAGSNSDMMAIRNAEIRATNSILALQASMESVLSRFTSLNNCLKQGKFYDEDTGQCLNVTVETSNEVITIPGYIHGGANKTTFAAPATSNINVKSLASGGSDIMLTVNHPHGTPKTVNISPGVSHSQTVELYYHNGGWTGGGKDYCNLNYNYSASTGMITTSIYRYDANCRVTDFKLSFTVTKLKAVTPQ